MAAKTLDTLFHDTLRDVYYAERKALQGLRRMARGAQAEELRAAFETHREETQGQIERLQRVFEIIGKRAQGKTCAAMDGITEEAEEIMEEYKDSPALDAGLLAAAQAVEHYEITRYGTLAAWADQLGLTEAVGLLRETLAEEERTDALLTQLAVPAINSAAEQQVR
jgi:ferritin-like metal-binding protein YciE